VDADPGEEVASEDIVKGYALDKDNFVEVTKEELEDLALESTRTIKIDEFVERDEIDPRYLIRPYYLRPDGKVGHDAFAVIRETIREMNKVAIGRVVLTNREHIVALEPLEKGLVGTLLRYPYEVRSEEEYFDEIQDVKVTKDTLMARWPGSLPSPDPEAMEPSCLDCIELAPICRSRLKTSLFDDIRNAARTSTNVGLRNGDRRILSSGRHRPPRSQVSHEYPEG